MSVQDKNLKIAKPVRITESNYHVNVVIPFCGQYHLVIRLVESILRLVRTPKYKITLVDDGSKSSNLQNSFTKIGGVTVLRNDKTLGFGASVNKAVKESDTDFVCVVHSDVILTSPNLFSSLAQCLIEMKNDKVAFVSARTNNPMSRDLPFLQATEAEAGSPVIIQTSQYLPFICTMFSRPVFQKLGGFFEFPHCWFEDKLLSMQCHSCGYRMAVDPASYVIHDGAMTIKSMAKQDSNFIDAIKANYATYQNQIKVQNLS